MVRILLIGSGDERNKKLQSLERELEKQKERIASLQDLLVDGSLTSEDYSRINKDILQKRLKSKEDYMK